MNNTQNFLHKFLRSIVFATGAAMATAAGAADVKDTTAAKAKDKPAAAANAAAATQKTFAHHLGAFADGLDAVMTDYSDRSILITPTKTYRGKQEIRAFFDAFMKGAEPGFWQAFKIRTQLVDGETAFLVWEAKPFMSMATDTFIVRNKKIVTQTFTPFAE